MNGAPGTEIGPWLLGNPLGKGGNGTVWSATRDGSLEPIALKVINTNKIEREPYQRFVREITFLQEHQSVEGVLPFIDAYLPAHPTSKDRPWLAMPVATPISSALRGRPLAEVVEAVSAIADTLRRLQSDHGVAHRDIKPGNLYELDGSWLIGDFGLVALPDSDGLTQAGKPLGPAHYRPYEMILDPLSADPHAADIYSLGKTLWVLATDLRFPPEGHQPAGTRAFGVGDFRPHPHAGALDRQIDLMTQLHPEDRPSKEQTVRDLDAWRALSDQPVIFDVSDARARLREKLSAEIARQDSQLDRERLTNDAVGRLQRLTAPLNEGLRQLSGRTIVDSPSDELTAKTLKTTASFGSPQVVSRWQRCTVVVPMDQPSPVTLRMSRCLELLRDGSIALHLMVLVKREEVMSSYFHWRRDATAQVGTIEAELMLEKGVADMAAALEDSIEVLVEQMPDMNKG